MSAATFLSRMLGYVRDMVFGALFGAGNIMDSYLVAFRIPNLFREIFAEGSMSAAFVPVLTETRERDGEEESRRLVRATFTAIITVVGGLCAAGVLFAPAIVTVIAPGWLDNPEKFRTTVMLTRIIFPFLLFVSLAAMAMGALNTKDIFFLPALAPAMLNIITISTVMVLVSRVKPPIVAAALGMAAGGLMQFLMQLPSFFRKGYSLAPLFQFNHPGLKKMVLLIIPVIFAMSTNQVNIFVTNILASFLPEGSITYLYYGMRLIHFPIGIFGVAMATAVLPTLSKQALSGDMDMLRETFSFSIRLLFFVTLPAMAGLIALRIPIVSTLFGHGRFGEAGISGTASALLYYSVGIWSMVGMRVAASTFYSMQDTRTPVRVAVAGLLSNMVLSVVLMRPLGHKGLALANALASGLQFSLLMYFLRNKMGGVDGKRILGSFVKTGLISIAMGISGWLLLKGGPWSAGSDASGQAIMLFSGIAACTAFYFIASRLFGSAELDYLIQWRSRRYHERGDRGNAA